MNAIYARQSVDKADSISIESQVEFCAYELKGAPYQVYSDKGYSGKNTDRPSFARMMDDIERGLVQKVVVYKLDRISRSILDFSTMIEKFRCHGVEFVSTMEKFDTTSPMGRAMLSICIVFAQLERETIQRRVADAYFSRSRKSFYMGGRVPFGFRLVPTVLDGVSTSMYQPVPEEAELLREIYSLYSRSNCSSGDIIRHLADQGIEKNGKPWGRTELAKILKNPIYVRADLSVYQFYRKHGYLIENDPADFIGVSGCYLYSVSQKEESKSSKGTLVLAPHEGIISSEMWLRCREKCLSVSHPRPLQKAKNTWLAGKIKCGLCGYALVDKRYPSGHRYLLCSHRMNTSSCAGPGTIYSDEVEQLMEHEILNKLSRFSPRNNAKAISLYNHSNQAELGLLKIENEIEELLDRLKSADSKLFQYMNKRIAELDVQRQDLERQITALHAKTDIDPTETGSLSFPWQELTFHEKRQVVDLFIRVIHVTDRSVSIEWNI